MVEKYTKQWIEAVRARINDSAKLADFDAKLVERKKFFDAKELLEADKTILKEIGRLQNEQVELTNQIKDQELKITDFRKTGTGIMSKWTGSGVGFNDKYNYLVKMGDWLRSVKGKVYSNKFNIDWKGTKFAIDQIELKRLICIVTKKVSDIDVADFTAKLALWKKADGTDQLDATQQARAETLLGNLKVISTKLGLKKYYKKQEAGKPQEEDKTVRETWTVLPDPVTGTPPFPINDFFEFFQLISPRDNLSLIKSLDKTKIEQTNDWALAHIGKLIPKDGLVKLDQSVENENIYYTGDIQKGPKTEIKIEKGLEDWVDLYYAAFKDVAARAQYLHWRNGDGTLLEKIPYEQLEQDLLTKTFRDAYTYEYKNPATGETEIYMGITDPREEISKLEVSNISLQTRIDIIKDNIKTKGVERNEHDKKVAAELAKMVAEESKIQNIINGEINALLAEVDKTNFSAPDFKWSTHENILKAFFAIKMLEDVRNLENDGDDDKPLKDTARQSLYDSLLVKKGDGAAWNSIVQEYFETKGSSTSERIAKIKSEESKTLISLRYFRDTFLENVDVLTEIDKALVMSPLPVPAPSAVTALDVQNAIVAAAGSSAKPDDAVANTWIFPTTSSLGSEEKIKKFVEDNITNKKTEFLTHVDAKLSSDKPAGGTEDERIANFLKTKNAKKVIEAVISHKIEQPDQKKLITDKMLADKKDGKQPLDMSKYSTDPGTVESPKDAAIIEYEYREMTGKAHSYQGSQQGPGTPGGDPEKGFVEKWIAPYGYAGIWVPLLIIGALVAIFWQNIANWWNGPAEEGADVDKESE